MLGKIEFIYQVKMVEVVEWSFFPVFALCALAHLGQRKPYVAGALPLLLQCKDGHQNLFVSYFIYLVFVDGFVGGGVVTL